MTGYNKIISCYWIFSILSIEWSLAQNLVLKNFANGGIIYSNSFSNVFDTSQVNVWQAQV